MPKYWAETNFYTREFPRSGSKAEDGEKEKKRKRERLNDGNNNGQATHGARKHAWRTQAAWTKIKSPGRKAGGQKIFQVHKTKWSQN